MYILFSYFRQRIERTIMEQEIKKPVLLKVLLILTFIGSGMSMVSNLFLFAFFPQVKALATQMGTYNFLGTPMDLKPFFDINPYFYLMQGIFYGLSLAGAVMMWNLKKAGFHAYTIAQIILLMIPQLFIPHFPFPTMELLISFLFVFYYSRFLKIMQ